MAFEAGCDGVFLISMDHHCEVLEDQARAVKSRWPDKLVGINFLSRSAVDAIHIVAEAGLDMTWSDDAHVHTEQSLEQADAIQAALARFPGHQFFGGVAFKYKKPEPNPGLAATRAHARGIIATTSGAGTGKAAEVSKIALMSQALDGGPLAIASGITPDNVLEYAPYLSHILVATGVSKNEYDFDFELLCQLMGKLNTFAVTRAAQPLFSRTDAREPHPDTVDRGLIRGFLGFDLPGGITERYLQMFRLGRQAHKRDALTGVMPAVDGATLSQHTLIIGTSGTGRSRFLEKEAARRGISVFELQREMAPSEEQKAAHHQSANDRKTQAEVRLQSVRDAYWTSSAAASSEFSAIYDAIFNVIGIKAPSPAQMKAVFDLMPSNVIGNGVAWGFDDTDVRDSISVYVRENADAVRAALLPA